MSSCQKSLLQDLMLKFKCISLSLFRIGFPGDSDGKAPASNVGGPGSIPGLGRSPREENGYPLQYCCLENSMAEEPGELMVPGVAKSWTRLRN